MEKQTKSTEVQGTENAKRKPSASYTVKQMGENIKKLDQLGMISKEEVEVLQKMHKKIVEKFIGMYMDL